MSERDWKCYDSTTLDLGLLDPGIRDVVAWLIAHGFHTTDSGDGKHKLEHGWDEAELVPYPHVYMTVAPHDIADEANRLWRLLEHDHGIEVVQAWTEQGKPHIECLYDPMGAAVIGLFNVTSEMVKR